MGVWGSTRGLGAWPWSFRPSRATSATQANADSDMDGTSDVKELEIGDSPAVAGLPGTNLICPDIRYGCGARLATASPPVDRLGLFSAGLAVLGLTLLRRQHRLRNTA